jgi:HSP20 family protein
MGFLERWRPERELERFRNEFDEMIERMGFGRDWLGHLPLNRGFFSDREAPARLAIETRVENDKFVVRADLPGVEPKDVDIKVVGDVLTIKGSREEKQETNRADYFRREIRYGSFERSISLPEGIEAGDLKATYHDGVLELTAPMPKAKMPKEVKIEVEGPKPTSEKKTAA